MARWHCSLCCSPQPIAKVLRVFPKLALIFLVIHVVAMIYSVVHSGPPQSVKSKHDLPPGVVDIKMKNIEGSIDLKYFSGSNNNTRLKEIQDTKNLLRNKTREVIPRLKKLKVKDPNAHRQ